MYRVETAEALRQAESAIKVATEYGLDHWLSIGMSIKGWALVRNGRVKDGGAYLQEGIEKRRSMGAELSMSFHLGLQTEFLLQARKLDKALISIEEALAISSKTGDLVYAAELYRLKGQVLTCKVRRNLSSANAAQAEAYFRQAICTARRQHAKSLELRATVSLCRLWQKIGKTKEAKSKLAKIYDWFTEGFDTPDLKQAKALLAELS